MLALVYLVVMFVLGDTIGRRFFAFVSIPHRIASAFLCGLLLSSWWTYAIAYLFSNTKSPMLWGNVFFFVSAIGVILLLRHNPPKEEPYTSLDLGYARFEKWDWAAAGIFLLFATWMMFRTFTTGDGNIMIGHHQFPDFGSTLSIMQSFAEGHNFPTQYPHFTGERIRYHFLFYFQAGNLEYLGFNPAVANNILSIFSLTSLLILVMTLGAVLFKSRLVGRIGAALFFFHGSLSFIPFLRSQASFSDLLAKLNTMTLYLASGFPYRGEEWGVWSLNVYMNQRHLASAIGIFVLVMICFVIRHRENLEVVSEHSDLAEPENETGTGSAVGGETLETGAEHEADHATETSEANAAEHEADHAAETSGAPVAEHEAALIHEDPDCNDDDEDGEDDADNEDDEDDEDDEDEDEDEDEEDDFDLGAFLKRYSTFIFCGLLLGLLPMWNGAIFLGAATVLAALLLLFPLRRELMSLAVTAAIVSLPQIIYLKTGHVRPVGYSMFRWGFVIDNGGFFDVLYWTFFTFGLKWVLLAIALYFASGMQRRFLAAVSILLPLTYCFRFSEEVLANHKFINMWLVVVNIFVGYALVKLWNLKTGSTMLPTRIAAVILLLLITVGGAIDLMPIKNSYFINIKYPDDKLIEWVKANTDPSAIFLSHQYINHQILLAGRRLFYGDPYYAWGSDYDTESRDLVVKSIFEGKDSAEVYRLLKENNISYVAFDDQIRKVRQYVKNPNEELFVKTFPLVFNDDLGEYDNLKIYKVPEDFMMPTLNQPTAQEPGVNAFSAGEGQLPGKFVKPRGITVDPKGFIYVADTMNARVQKFAADGAFVSAFGTRGAGEGELKEPNGVALDQAGNIYVTDALNHKLVEYDANAKFIKEWKNPEVGFYGPRDLAFGPNGKLYIIDQGHTRLTFGDPGTDTFDTWGTSGSGEGQFNEPTGLAIGANLVFVADTGNNRVQVFDLEGKFVRQWDMPAWDHIPFQFPDIVYDDISKRLYISSGKSNEVLAYDIEGQLDPGKKPAAEEGLDNPSSMALLDVGKIRYLLVLNTGSAKVTKIQLENKAEAKSEPKKGK